MSQPQDPLVGQTLARYRIDKFIDRGGLAAVYLATDLLWEMPVAVKVLPDFFASDEEHRERFLREASTMANLVHPHIMSVRDYQQVQGKSFFVMDYASGGNLEKHMGRPLPPDDAWALLQPVAEAVAYAHGQGVVHRDLKPSNVLYDGEGRALIADFGIAKLMEESGLTRTRESLGTPDYMAPEQAREAGRVDASADVYALGCILFQLLTGQTPYPGVTAIDIIDKHKYDPIPSPRLVAPALPVPMDEFFRRVLAKDPAQRVQTVDEMMGLLQTALAGQTLPPDPRAPAISSVTPQTPFTSPPGGQTLGWTPPGQPSTPNYGQPVPPPSPPRQSPWLWVVAVLVVVAAAAAVLVYSLTQSPGPEKVYAEGLACYQAENWPCAVDRFTTVLTEDPAFKDAATRKAEAERRVAVESAWTQITRCQAPDPDDWACVYKQARIIFADLDPKDDRARSLFAEAAFHQAQDAQRTDPDAAIALLRDVKDDAQITQIPAGFEDLYDRLDGYLSGAGAYAGGDYGKAVSLLEPVADYLDSRGMLYQSHVRLCQVALKTDDLAAAQDHADEALRFDRSGSEALACADAIRQTGVESIMVEARSLLAAAKWQDAITTCQQALEVETDNSEAQACIGQANDALYQGALTAAQELLRKCQLDQAIAAFDEVLMYKPGDASAEQGKQQAAALKTPKTARIADSYDDWSSNQGSGGWHYLARASGADQQIGWGGDAFWWNRGEGSRIRQDSQHPGSGVDMVRRWVSPIAGSIVADIQYRLQDGRGNTLVYLNANGGNVLSRNAGGSGFQSARVGPLNVSPGSTLDLGVNSNGSVTYDNTMIRMTIFRQLAQCQPQ